MDQLRRAWPRARSGALFPDLRERTWRLHGVDRPQGDRSGDGPALRPAFSGHHAARHGARPGGPARPSGVERLLAVVGGSMGGMQVLEWAASYPARVRNAVVLATTARHSAQNIALHEVGRQAIMADPHWRGGDYYGQDEGPSAGLAVARMAAHITYMSEDGLTAKFGRSLQDRAQVSFGFDADFQVESYLRHQGIRFVERFDANSYLYITRAMDYFDLAENRGVSLAEALRPARDTRFCVVSFSSDWLYPTAESRRIVHALNACGAPVSFVEIDTPFGHDAFLLEVPELFRVAGGFMDAAARQ
ncbi:alpha/beta fold hydrolase [Hankyongella ginsenosidimutans]|uniref:alpha/beta fold hydrolase n=1 Tax=Hankyongella ginsenosidimutans TaxID=1763828 RepID=UPI001FE6186E|nr:homoserine O-acetyltransferase [Hankyongella ginsenosidimutans]